MTHQAASPRHALRAATAAAHARLDALYGGLDLARRDDYARFLTSHAAAFLPVETALAAAGAGAVFEGWLERPRGPALRADLAALGLAVPPPLEPPPFADEAALLGGLYVLEGSRLGGAVLVRAVPPDMPAAFLAPETVSTWRAFTDLLDRRLAAPDRFAHAAAAAEAVFALFERAARATLELAA